MRVEARPVIAILAAMGIGAAAATTVMSADWSHRWGGLQYFNGILGLTMWVRTLVLYSQGVDRENPSELASCATMATGLSATAAGLLLWSEEGLSGLLWTGAGFALILAALGLRLRAITTKYANKRKAQAQG
jgi:hypothetical protein